MNPWLTAQGLDCISETLQRCSNNPGLYFYCLHTFGHLLVSITAQNIKLFKNPELKASLMNCFQQLAKNSAWEDKLTSLTGIDEVEYSVFTQVFSGFLVLCELGDIAKIKSYESLVLLLTNNFEARKFAKSEEVVARLFPDTVNQNPRIRHLALETLALLLTDSQNAEFFLNKKLVSNLVSQVLTKFPESQNGVLKVLEAAKHPQVWKQVLKEEKQKLKALTKGNLTAPVKAHIQEITKYF